jgi:HAD superfamily hydrolase (TIGR01509 family)
MFDAVIFDWDGTLADTKHAVITSFQRVLEQIGCNVSNEFIERRIGIGTKNTLKDALKATNIPFDEELIEELSEKKIQTQLTLIETVGLFEGAIELLNALYGKMKIALASMGNRKIVDNLLGKNKLRKYFNIVVTADEIIHPKPDPEIFLKCATKLDCQPQKCAVIEDSVFGVRAAKKARMKCVAISSGAYSRKELKEEKPDLIVNSIEEKEKILNFMFCKRTSTSNSQ